MSTKIEQLPEKNNILSELSNLSNEIFHAWKIPKLPMKEQLELANQIVANNNKFTDILNKYLPIETKTA